MNIYYLDLAKYFDFFHEKPINKNAESFKKLIKNPDNKVILSALHEVWPQEKILSALEILNVTPDQNNVVLLLGDYYRHCKDSWGVANIILYDSLLTETYFTREADHRPHLEIDKFLFILGKPYKKQRIFALYDLYQRDCLDKAEWSFHYSPDFDGILRNYLPAMPDDEYSRFITSTNRKIDEIQPIFIGDAVEFHHYGFTPDIQLFSKASISLIGETLFSRDVFSVTEKTWKAIKNFHPFVVIGYKERYEYLESLGVDTFQYLVKHPYEKLIGSEEEVIKMCNDNILYMLDNKNSHKERIMQSVSNNYAVFENLANSYSQKLHPYIEDLLWKQPYQKVKADIAAEVYEKLWNKNGAVGED